MAANEHDPHDAHDHSATPRASAFLWGSIALGVLLVLLLVTHGFGLLGRRGGGGSEAPAMVRQGQRIFIPENSPLRQRLTVMPAPTQLQSGTITAPGIVESDPARTVAVLPAGGGRVQALKIALGDRVQRDQVLAVIDSPDVALAYDDNDKAASLARLAARNLQRTEEQLRSAPSRSAIWIRPVTMMRRRLRNTAARVHGCARWAQRRRPAAAGGC